MRKSFVMYAEWADQIINMAPDLAGEYIQAILKYAIYGLLSPCVIGFGRQWLRG